MGKTIEPFARILYDYIKRSSSELWVEIGNFAYLESLSSDLPLTTAKCVLPSTQTSTLLWYPVKVTSYTPRAYCKPHQMKYYFHNIFCQLIKFPAIFFDKYADFFIFTFHLTFLPPLSQHFSTSLLPVHTCENTHRVFQQFF
jgi:hypothetical protein